MYITVDKALLVGINERICIRNIEKIKQFLISLDKKQNFTKISSIVLKILLNIFQYNI